MRGVCLEEANPLWFYSIYPVHIVAFMQRCHSIGPRVRKALSLATLRVLYPVLLDEESHLDKVDFDKIKPIRLDGEPDLLEENINAFQWLFSLCDPRSPQYTHTHLKAGIIEQPLDNIENFIEILMGSVARVVKPKTFLISGRHDKDLILMSPPGYQVEISRPNHPELFEIRMFRPLPSSN